MLKLPINQLYLAKIKWSEISDGWVFWCEVVDLVLFEGLVCFN